MFVFQESSVSTLRPLEFAPVRRKDSGTYICQAENSIGLSNEEPTELDVQRKKRKERTYLDHE